MQDSGVNGLTTATGRGLAGSANGGTARGGGLREACSRRQSWSSQPRPGPKRPSCGTTDLSQGS
eukprot:1524271-Pyramimonas_sp.AAC.1